MLLTRLPVPPSFITIGNGQTLPISGRGTSVIPLARTSFVLNNILVVPNIVRNLLSVHQFTHDNNCSIEFYALDFSKDLQTTHLILRCNSDGDLYTLPVCQLRRHPPPPATLPFHHPYGITTSAIPVLQLSPLFKSSAINCNKATCSVCHACQLGKHTCLPFASSTSHASASFASSMRCMDVSCVERFWFQILFGHG